ncbi:MAG: VirB4 family type IV secretion/conjugal transfer ATPase [Lautropia sp.]
MRSIAELRAARASQVPLADYIPMGVQIAPGIVKLHREAVYIATWRVDGITFEARDPEDIGVAKEGLNNFLRNLADGRWSIWTHRIRRQVHERLDANFENAFCRDLVEQYYASFDQHKQMATELYITLLFRPSRMPVPTFRRKGSGSALAELQAREDDDMAILEDMGRSLERSLEDYGPARLTTYEKKGRVYSEMARLYGYLVNGVWEEVALRTAALYDYLPSSRLHFGDRNGMLEIWHPQGVKYAGFLDIQEYPGYSEPGMTSCLLYTDYEYIETQSFSIMPKRRGIKEMTDQKGHLVATEDVGRSQIAAMDEALDELEAGKIDLGEYHYTIAVFGENLQSTANNMADARAAMADLSGFKMAVIDVIPECAWFAQLPGNWRMRPRSAKLTTRNFASLAPQHNFASGKREGNPWGEALALMQTPSGQPFYLNFHVSPPKRDSTDEKIAGNTFICGSTGSGKTTLQMALLASATKYPDFRAFMLDLDRGSEIGIRAMGGKYTPLVFGEKTGFNPFQMEPTAANESFCVGLVSKLVSPEGTVPLTPREEQDIRNAVHGVLHEVAFKQRRLAVIDQMLMDVGENSVKQRLRKWIAPNTLGWVFDNPRDTQDFGTHSIYAYDYTEFLDNPEIRTPVLMYLLHVADTLQTGRPFIRIIEEFWKALLDDTLLEKSRKDLKTDRKLSSLGVYVTQSPSDVLTSPISRTIVEQCDTQIYLPNPRATPKDYIEGFRCTHAEFELIRNLDPLQRTFLVKQGRESSLVKFDLNGMTDLLNVISGSLDNVALLDEIRAEVGDAPDVWLPIFHRKIAERRENTRAWVAARQARAA